MRTPIKQVIATSETEAGKAEKQVFSREWLGISHSMNSILGEENE